jgi:hypothetical protein
MFRLAQVRQLPNMQTHIDLLGLLLILEEELNTSANRNPSETTKHANLLVHS